MLDLFLRRKFSVLYVKMFIELVCISKCLSSRLFSSFYLICIWLFAAGSLFHVWFYVLVSHLVIFVWHLFVSCLDCYFDSYFGYLSQAVWFCLYVTFCMCFRFLVAFRVSHFQPICTSFGFSISWVFRFCLVSWVFRFCLVSMVTGFVRFPWLQVSLVSHSQFLVRFFCCLTLLSW